MECEEGRKGEAGLAHQQGNTSCDSPAVLSKLIPALFFVLFPPLFKAKPAVDFRWPAGDFVRGCHWCRLLETRMPKATIFHGGNIIAK